MQAITQRNFPSDAKPPILATEHLRRHLIEALRRRLYVKTLNRFCEFGELLSAESVFNEKEEGQAPTAAAFGLTDFYTTKENYMLILTRKVGESIVINDDIKVTILGVKGMQVRIGIDAPKDVQVHREEIFKRIQAGNPAPEKGNEEHQ